jgi:hypothetical protein
MILTYVQYTRLLTEKPAATPYSLTQWTEKSTTVDPIGLHFCWIHNDRFPLLAKLHYLLQRLCSLYSSCATTRPLNNVIINDNQWHVTRILLNRRYTSAQFRSAPRGRLRSRVNTTQRHLDCYYFYSNLSLGEAD